METTDGVIVSSPHISLAYKTSVKSGIKILRESIFKDKQILSSRFSVIKVTNVKKCIFVFSLGSVLQILQLLQ